MLFRLGWRPCAFPAGRQSVEVQIVQQRYGLDIGHLVAELMQCRNERHADALCPRTAADGALVLTQLARCDAKLSGSEDLTAIETPVPMPSVRHLLVPLVFAGSRRHYISG
jgi:hypothetical protein